jgi:hypothetical protein
MADFDIGLPQTAREGLQDFLSKMANALRVSSSTTVGQLIVNGAIGSVITPLAGTGTVSLDTTQGSTFSITPTANVTVTAASVVPGQDFSMIVSAAGATASAYTVAFATGFKSTGPLSTSTTTTKYFTVSFTSDGTQYYEICRTAAM